MDNEWLILFVGIIAVCMVLITGVIIVIGWNALKMMQRFHEFMGVAQNEFSFLSTKAALTLHEVNELLIHLKEQSGSLGGKSMQALHELHDLLSYIHEETKDLALKASNGIAKVTIGSLAIGALAQMFRKHE